jgi:hypothetical protein
MNKPDTKALTPRMLHFARCVASGMTQSTAYRESYNVGKRTLNKSVHEKASQLMSRVKIRSRVEYLIKQREHGLIASSLSDKESVLEVLRDKMRTADSDSNKLRAAELLGKTVGLFRDVVETPDQRTPEEIRAELKELMAEVFEADCAVH